MTKQEIINKERSRDTDGWEQKFYSKFTHDWPPEWNYPSSKGATPKDAIDFICQLLESNMNTNPPKITTANKTETMATTIACPEGTVYDGECCGCLSANYDPLEKIWIFRCNECGKEFGRG
jgi:hypothetical protein